VATQGGTHLTVQPLARRAVMQVMQVMQVIDEGSDHLRPCGEHSAVSQANWRRAAVQHDRYAPLICRVHPAQRLVTIAITASADHRGIGAGSHWPGSGLVVGYNSADGACSE
jgi:hypothetical protein